MISLLLTAIAILGGALIVGATMGLFNDFDPALRENRRRVAEARKLAAQSEMRVDAPVAPTTVFGRYMEDIEIDLVEAGMPGTSPYRWLAYSVALAVAVVGGVGLVVGSWLWAIAGGIAAYLYLRNGYIGKAATKRANLVTLQSAEAARTIANTIREGQPAERALALYASRARRNSPTALLIGDEPLVAKALLEAELMITERSLTAEFSYSEVARSIGNRAFTDLVDTYLQFYRVNHMEMAQAIVHVAEETEWAMQLRTERKTYLSQPLTNYTMLGYINGALFLVLTQLNPASATFATSLAGQVFALVVAGWWFIGYRLQRRKLRDRE